jgi:tetratricopeptide (TPR) repeat protein
MPAKNSNTSTQSKEARSAYNTGYLAFMKGKYKDAIPFFKLALRLDSAYIDAIDNLAFTYRRLNMIDSAEFCYKHSLKINSGNMLAMNNLALLYLMQEKFDLASEYYNKMIQVDSLSGDGYYGLAQINFKRKDFDFAIKYGMKAFKIWEKTNRQYAGESMMYVGMAQCHKGDKANAKISLQKAQNMGAHVPADYLKVCK